MSLDDPEPTNGGSGANYFRFGREVTRNDILTTVPAPCANSWIGKPDDRCNLQNDNKRKRHPIGDGRIVSAMGRPEVDHKAGRVLEEEGTRYVAGA